MTKAPHSSDVLIVGGGFAGLAAAVKLLRAGVSLQIAEKRPFFGGGPIVFPSPRQGK